MYGLGQFTIAEIQSLADRFNAATSELRSLGVGAQYITNVSVEPSGLVRYEMARLDGSTEYASAWPDSFLVLVEGQEGQLASAMNRTEAEVAAWTAHAAAANVPTPAFIAPPVIEVTPAAVSQPGALIPVQTGPPGVIPPAETGAPAVITDVFPTPAQQSRSRSTAFWVIAGLLGLSIWVGRK